jgi:hypothetical protein
LYTLRSMTAEASSFVPFTCADRCAAISFVSQAASITYPAIYLSPLHATPPGRPLMPERLLRRPDQSAVYARQMERVNRYKYVFLVRTWRISGPETRQEGRPWVRPPEHSLAVAVPPIRLFLACLEAVMPAALADIDDLDGYRRGYRVVCAVVDPQLDLVPASRKTAVAGGRWARTAYDSTGSRAQPGP